MTDREVLFRSELKLRALLQTLPGMDGPTSAALATAWMAYLGDTEALRVATESAMPESILHGLRRQKARSRDHLIRSHLRWDLPEPEDEN